MTGGVHGVRWEASIVDSASKVQGYRTHKTPPPPPGPPYDPRYGPTVGS